MAFTEHYLIPFQSIDGINYQAVIYEDGYEGDTVTLTAAARPFETGETQDDDPFTPIRTQTGYLRVIDTDGTLADSLFPSSNIEKMVRLFCTDDNSIKWQGFLACSSYNQAWINSPHEIELPINSLLETMKSATIPSDSIDEVERLGKLMVLAMQKMTGSTDATFLSSVLTTIWMMGAVDNGYLWPQLQIPYYLFYQEDEIINGDVTVSEYTGKTFYDIFTDICLLYGYTLRENGTQFYFTAFDEEFTPGHSASVHYYTMNFSSFLNGNYQSVASHGYMSDVSLLNNFVFAGSDSSQNLVPGRRIAIVSLEIDTKTPSLTMPETPASGDTPQAWSWMGAYRIQPFQTRGSNLETFGYFGIYYMTLTEGTSSTYANALLWSQQSNPGLDNDDFPSYWAEMFSMPIRISYGEEHLQSGLLVCRVVNNSETGSPIYTLQSARTYDFSSGGYLKLDIEYSTQYAGGDTPEAIHTFWVKLGNRYWNVSSGAWQSSAPGAHESNYPFTATSGKIENNASDFPDDESDLGSEGYFIPLEASSASAGALSVIIPQFANYGVAGNHGFGARVITKMELSFVRKKDDLVSERTSNVYREEILLNGFPDEVSETLGIGTYNLNIDSPTFIQDATSGDYIQKFTYALAARSQRPEQALVERLAKLYSKGRHIYSATIKIGNDLNKMRYLYNNSPHLVLSCNRRWAEDKEEIRVIELTADSEY